MDRNKIVKNKKILSIFFIEIAEILQQEFYNNKKFLVTLINVKFNHNINFLKLYINIYPFSEKNIIIHIKSKLSFYRNILSKKLRYRIKKIPKLGIYIINK
ncbi:ribosome-binding factor A [Blattabacterium cuenoti]|uniref:ribosome-binding factor A n=1 Tax=Blattabacterium cuenoti TaxID=1653831 RepID=UPI00163BB8BF|nr:ribosome-binding factor A [Blattabacterium cuenoti]